MSELPDLPALGPEYAADSLSAVRHYQAAGPLGEQDGVIEVLDEGLIDRLIRDRRLVVDQDEMLAAVGISDPRADRFRREMMLSLNGPPHVKLRASVAAAFSPGGVLRFRPVVRELIDELLRTAPQGEPIDLFEQVCSKVPSQLFCRLIDVPLEKAEFVGRISDSILKIFLHDSAHAAEIEAAYVELFDYVAGVIAERREALGEDLLSTLIRLEIDGVISGQQLEDMVVMLLEASTDNTSNQMGMVVATLLERPEALERLRADPELLTGAVAEGIRFCPRVLALRRTAGEEIEIDGVSVPAGTTLRFPVLAVQRSADRYPDPDTFDVTRKPGRPLTTFGGGAHACLGAPLAQVEIEEMVAAIVDGYPRIQLAGTPRIFHNPFIQGVEELPVVLCPVESDR